MEVEYKEGQERVYAMRGAVGASIGSVPSSSKESERLFAEIAALKKAKKVEAAGATYRARVEEFESFGEIAYRIRLAKLATKKA